MVDCVILLPGVITPAAIAYGALIPELAGDFRVVAKDLAVYDGDLPPSGYSLDTEVESVLASAKHAGFDRFHLVGYSGGGAVAAVMAARHPMRITSLILMEPAWLGNRNLTEAELAVRRSVKAPKGLPQQMFQAFARLQVAEGVQIPGPPASGPPAWMAKRPRGIVPLNGAFDQEDLDLTALHDFERPVLFVIGGLSNSDFFGAMADRGRTMFRNVTVELFPDRHHFDPPHRAESKALAAILAKFWKLADVNSVGEM